MTLEKTELDHEDIDPAVWVAVAYAVKLNEIIVTQNQDKADELYHAVRYQHRLPEYAEGRKYLEEAISYCLQEIRLPADTRNVLRQHLKRGLQVSE